MLQKMSQLLYGLSEEDDFKDKRVDGNIAFRDAGGVEALGAVLKGVVSEDSARSFAAKAVANLAGEYVNDITAPTRRAIQAAGLTTALVQILRKDSKRVESGRTGNPELNTHCKEALAALLGGADEGNTAQAVAAGVVPLLVVELAQPDSMAHALTAFALYSLAAIEAHAGELASTPLLAAVERVMASPSYRKGTKLLCALTLAMVRGWCGGDTQTAALMNHEGAPLPSLIPKTVESAVSQPTFLGLSWDLQGVAVACRSLLMHPQHAAMMSRGLDISEALFTIAKGPSSNYLGVVTVYAQVEALRAFAAMAAASDGNRDKLLANTRLSALITELTSLSNTPLHVAQAAADLSFVLSSPLQAPLPDTPPPALAVVVCSPPDSTHAIALHTALTEAGVASACPCLNFTASTSPQALAFDAGIVCVVLVTSALHKSPEARMGLQRARAHGRPVIAVQMDEGELAPGWVSDLLAGSPPIPCPTAPVDYADLAQQVRTALSTHDGAALLQQFKEQIAPAAAPDTAPAPPPDGAQEVHPARPMNGGWGALEGVEELRAEVERLGRANAELSAHVRELMEWRVSITPMLSGLLAQTEETPDVAE